MGVTQRRLIAIALVAVVSGCGDAGESPRPAAEPDEASGRVDEPRRGELPEDGAARVDGVDLPAGRRQRDEDGHVVLWRTDMRGDEALDAWRRLAEAFPRTGLWPVLIGAGESQPDFWRERGWERAAAADPERVLRTLWKEGLPLGAGERLDYAEQVLAPFGAEFPGLAAGGGERTGDDASLLAAEQKAFCPDIVEQGTGTIGALAADLDGSPAWFFWWD